MITVEEWEAGKEIGDELFKAVFVNVLGYRELSHFVGMETGTILHRDFSEVLEPEASHSPSTKDGQNSGEFL